MTHSQWTSIKIYILTVSRYRLLCIIIVIIIIETSLLFSLTLSRYPLLCIWLKVLLLFRAPSPVLPLLACSNNYHLDHSHHHNHPIMYNYEEYHPHHHNIILYVVQEADAVHNRKNTTNFHQHWTSIAGLSRKRLGSVPCWFHLRHRLEVLQHLGGVLKKRCLSAKERHSSVWNSLKSEFQWSGLEATAEPNPIPPSLPVRSSEDQLLFCKGLSFQAFAFKLTNNSIRGGRIFTQLSEVSPHFHFPALRCFAFPACAHGSSTLMRSPLLEYSPPL